jgi:gas vesicle structural protein
MRRRSRRRRRHNADSELDASLLDLVDHVLNKGVVVTGDVMLGLADVDLIYLRLTALLCAADRVTPGESSTARPAPPRRLRR